MLCNTVHFCGKSYLKISKKFFTVAKFFEKISQSSLFSFFVQFVQFLPFFLRISRIYHKKYHSFSFFFPDFSLFQYVYLSKLISKNLLKNFFFYDFKIFLFFIFLIQNSSFSIIYLIFFSLFFFEISLSRKKIFLTVQAIFLSK